MVRRLLSSLIFYGALQNIPFGQKRCSFCQFELCACSFLKQVNIIKLIINLKEFFYFLCDSAREHSIHNLFPIWYLISQEAFYNLQMLHLQSNSLLHSEEIRLVFTNLVSSQDNFALKTYQLQK